MLDCTEYGRDYSRHATPEGGAAPGSALRGPARLWRLWRQRVSDRERLSYMTERELRDMGLTRADVYRAMSQPFWREECERRMRLP